MKTNMLRMEKWKNNENRRLIILLSYNIKPKTSVTSCWTPLFHKSSHVSIVFPAVKTICSWHSYINITHDCFTISPENQFFMSLKSIFFVPKHLN